MLGEFDAIKPILMERFHAYWIWQAFERSTGATAARKAVAAEAGAVGVGNHFADTFEEEHCRTFMLYMSHLAAEPPERR